MSELLIFSFGSSIILTTFMVVFIEFIMGRMRKAEDARKAADVEVIKEEYEKEIAHLKKRYQKVETELKEAHENPAQSGINEEERLALIEEYEQKLTQTREENNQEVEKAKEKIKAMREAAKIEVADYMEKREKEVEGQLMDLVLSVTKKVLPEGLEYEIQKELIAKALHNIYPDK